MGLLSGVSGMACVVSSRGEGNLLLLFGPSRGGALGWKSEWKTGNSQTHLMERLLEGERPFCRE